MRTVSHNMGNPGGFLRELRIILEDFGLSDYDESERELRAEVAITTLLAEHGIAVEGATVEPERV